MHKRFVIGFQDANVIKTLSKRRLVVIYLRGPSQGMMTFPYSFHHKKNLVGDNSLILFAYYRLLNFDLASPKVKKEIYIFFSSLVHYHAHSFFQNNPKNIRVRSIRLKPCKLPIFEFPFLWAGDWLTWSTIFGLFFQH